MKRSYLVKELFMTLHGEGARAGTAAVFLRFAGCNLWSGREEDRFGASCTFCDTDFVGGKRLHLPDILEAVWAAWPISTDAPWVVVTGGEPLLQLDRNLIDALRLSGIRVAVETNGTLPLKFQVDWLTVSPKAGTEWVHRHGQELKLVYPQPGLMPDEIDAPDFLHHCLQPMDGPAVKENTAAAVAYCRTHPKWRLSLQMHKILGIR